MVTQLPWIRVRLGGQPSCNRTVGSGKSSPLIYRGNASGMSDKMVLWLRLSYSDLTVPFC